METPSPPSCIAFDGMRRIAIGPLPDVALRVRTVLDQEPGAQVLVFDAATSALLEIDTRGTPEDVLSRLSAPQPPAAEVPARPRATGRPKLGVVAREVTLLPRHWEWLGRQPGGASVTLRRLVDEARRVNDGTDRLRQAQEKSYRFMSAIAGDLPGFEETTRALFAGRSDRFHALTQSWPEDVRDYARQLAAEAFSVSGNLPAESGETRGA
jgi:uncharacterized protein